jgi:hypothetical protein
MRGQGGSAKPRAEGAGVTGRSVAWRERGARTVPVRGWSHPAMPRRPGRLGSEDPRPPDARPTIADDQQPSARTWWNELRLDIEIRPQGLVAVVRRRPPNRLLSVYSAELCPTRPGDRLHGDEQGTSRNRVARRCKAAERMAGRQSVIGPPATGRPRVTHVLPRSFRGSKRDCELSDFLRKLEPALGLEPRTC